MRNGMWGEFTKYYLTYSVYIWNYPAYYPNGSLDAWDNDCHLNPWQDQLPNGELNFLKTEFKTRVLSYANCWEAHVNFHLGYKFTGQINSCCVF